MRKAILVAVAVAVASPAVAGCPYGQILRVSMGKCVSVHSKLAAGYVRTAHKRTRIVVALPPAKPAPVEAPEIEVLRERLMNRVASLTATDILLSRAAALVEK
jgi:hypothetical protein